MKYLIAIFLIGYSNFLWATSFAKTFGGLYDDFAYSILETNDGYIVAGYTNSFGAGGSDFLIIKLSYNGEIEWAKTFGEERSEELYSIDLTDDGGYILAGSTTSWGPSDFDVLIIKLSSNGNIETIKSFFGGGTDEIATFIQKTNDGYIISGYTWPLGAGEKDCLVLKLSSNLNIEWGREYGGITYDASNSIKQTTDGGYILTGYTQSFGSSGSVLVIKLLNNGIPQWARIFGGGNIDAGNSVQQTSDGGYIVAGYTSSFGAGGSDFLIIKTHDNQMSPDCPWYSFYPTVTFADFSYSYLLPVITSPSIISYSPPIEVSSPPVQTFDVCTPVSSKEIILRQKIIVKSFPFIKNKISLIFSEYYEGKIKIILYDIVGNEIFSKIFDFNNYIEIKDKKFEKLKKGIYFLKIYLNEKEIEKFRMIKI
jgi:hypothetical protein